MKGIVVVRGALRNLPDQKLRDAHDALLGDLKGPGRALGNVGHRAYRNRAHAGELMVIDTWENIEGAEKLMADPELPARFADFFDAMPDVSVWSQTDWDGYDR